MATYYIDPAGDDGTGDGSIGTPWATLKKACTIATTGDTIHVNAGIYDGLDAVTTAILATGVKIEGEGDSSILTYSGAVSTFRYITAESVGQGTVANNEICYLKFDGNSLTMPTGIRIRNRGSFHIHHCTFVDINYAAIDLLNWDGVTTVTEPTTYAEGIEINDNTITNCSRYLTGVTSGSIQFGGTKGMLIHDNDIQNVVPGVNRGIPLKGINRWHKALQVYNNTILKIHTGSNLPFSMELWDGAGGIDIYNNTIWGMIDLVRCLKYEYSYGVKIHDNNFDLPENATKSFPPCGIEWSAQEIYFYRNSCMNMCNSFGMSSGGGSTVIDGVYIYYNLFGNIGSLNDSVQYQRAINMTIVRYSCVITEADDLVTFTESIANTFSNGDTIRFSVTTGSLPPELDTTTVYTIINKSGGAFQVSTDGINPIDISVDSTPTVYIQPLVELKNVYIQNNIFDCKEVDGLYPNQAALFMEPYGTIDNLNLKNNIIIGFDTAPVWGRGNDCVTTNFSIENNILYNNGNSDDPYYDFGFVPDAGTYSVTDNLKVDPKFVLTKVDYSLQADSPAIDTGQDVGLTSDFIGTLVPYGSAPDIGAYEWFLVDYDFSQITLVNTPACHDEDDPSIISRWVATEVPILFTLLRRDWYVISTADNGGFVRINILGTFGGNDDDTIALYDETTESMYTGTITDSSAAPIIDTDIPYVAGMEFRYMNDHTLYPNYYFEGRLTIEGVLEPLTVTASPDRFGLADLDVSGILRIHTAIGKVTNYLSLIQKDTNKSGNFTLEYRGCWFGSDEDYIQEGSETSPVEANVWYFAEAVRSEEQGCNLAEYVPSDENEAPFLNQFDQPVYWHGLPFDLSFILPELVAVTPEADITVTIKVYDSTHSQIGVDIVQTIAADEMEGYVNSLNIDSALIDEGAAYFTVEITTV